MNTSRVACSSCRPQALLPRGQARSRTAWQPSRARAHRDVLCAANAGHKFSIHIGETTISVPLSLPQGQQLDAAFTALLQTFASKAKATRPQRWDMMEVRFAGDPSAGELELFEVFCNPNAHPTPFDAKLLISIRAPGGVSVTTEGRLVGIKSDLDTFLQGST